MPAHCIASRQYSAARVAEQSDCHSASLDDVEAVRCWPENQSMGPFAMKKIYPVQLYVLSQLASAADVSTLFLDLAGAGGRADEPYIVRDPGWLFLLSCFVAFFVASALAGRSAVVGL